MDLHLKVMKVPIAEIMILTQVKRELWDYVRKVQK